VVPGGRDAPEAGVDQQNQADRDVYAAGRDQTVIRGQTVINDNRRVELAAGAIPHPAAVNLARLLAGLPRRPARVFAGRDQALAVLGQALTTRGGAVVTQAIYGLGGVGKSELALQYAHARREDYGLVWWITAADPGQAEAGLAALAGRLCPAVAVAGTTSDAAGWATGWLQAHDRWLLILDNVEDPADIEPLLGQLGGGHVIITSRRDTDWGQLADPVRLDVLTPAAAAQVLILRTGQHDAADTEAAAQVAAELGFLPLALDQAAAYITQQRITPAAYLDSLRRNPARMHAAGPSAQRTIARLWDLHITAVRHRSPAAARLLGVIACYAPDAIPRAMLGRGAPVEDTDEALGLLASYSMITLTTTTVSIHRLLQAVTLTRPGDTGDDPRSLRDTALDWLNAAIPDDPDVNMAGWPLLRALVPHAEALASHFPPGQQPQALGRVQNEIGLFLSSQGDYAQALSLRQSALAIAEAALGPGHPSTAATLGNLALTYCDLGRHAEALPLHERALAITETALGPGHPSTAISLGNLAAAYRALGRPAEALPLHERALAIAETALGPGHPDTAIRLNNLALTYGDLRRYAEALPLAERALAITEAALGPGHPSTATRLDNLAITYIALGRPAEALPLHERALAITEAALGPGHPDTALRLASLAVTYIALGRTAEALPLTERALAITEAALGPSHPDTALWLGLAGIYRELGRPADALPLEERAAQIRQRPQLSGAKLAPACGRAAGSAPFRGPGAALTSQAAIERAIQPAKPVRAIAG
jgi:tetratricopeptide (TPR) repeat protein